MRVYVFAMMMVPQAVVRLLYSTVHQEHGADVARRPLPPSASSPHHLMTSPPHHGRRQATVKRDSGETMDVLSLRHGLCARARVCVCVCVRVCSPPGAGRGRFPAHLHIHHRHRAHPGRRKTGRRAEGAHGRNFI